MIQKTNVDMERRKLVKTVRSAIRLKYALLADDEINQVLPPIEAEFDRRLSAGEPYALDIESVLNP